MISGNSIFYSKLLNPKYTAGFLLKALLFFAALIPYQSTGNVANPVGKASIELSQEEKEYLAQLKKVRICFDPDWEPFESLNKDGEYVGIGADLLSLIAERAGISIELKKTNDWDESLEFSRIGKCQIITLLNQTPEREKWLIFTDPYFTDHNVFITREEHDFISNPALLTNATIVLPTGTSVEERIRADYPNLNIILVENERDAINMVSEKKADMTLRSLTLAAYTIRKQGLFNLKIAGQLPEYTNQLRLGIIQDEPILRDILNKAIHTLTAEEVQQIVNNHISIQMQTGKDYTMAIRIAIISAILLCIGLLWTYQLQRLNKKLASKQQELVQLSRTLQQDIMARKKVEEALRQSEERLSALISDLPGMVYRCKFDREYTMKYVSQGCEPLTGYPPSAFIDNNILSFNDIIHPACRERIFRIWETKLSEREQVEVEYRILHASGEERWVWERGHGVFGPHGEVLFLEGFITDITDRKNAESAIRITNEELKRINSEKDKFFSIIAHDLKNPFNSIIGFSELLSEQVKQQDYQGLDNYAKNILKSSQRVMDLLSNLMDWSSSQTGRMSFNPMIIEFRTILDQVLLLSEGTLIQKSINIEIKSPADLKVFADKDMLSTVMRNLLSNAIKFSRMGGTIEISADSNCENVRISVKDSGIGIAPYKLDKLFRFDISHSSPGTLNEKGNGLGLILCKEFIGKHSGEIWVESKENEGSTFSFSLPLNNT